MLCYGCIAVLASSCWLKSLNRSSAARAKAAKISSSDRPTIADCAVYPYVVLAPEGDVDLTPYSHVADWMKRLEALPGYLPKP